MSKSKAESGKLGGLATLERHGHEQMRAWGALGGRPKLPTLDEIKRQKALAFENKYLKGGSARGIIKRKWANKNRGAAV